MREDAWRRIVMCLVCTALAIAGLRAQTTRDVHGTVRDETGGVLVGAVVTLEDDMGHRYATRTNERGQYQITATVPGTYSLLVTFGAFSPFVAKVDLASVASLVVDPTLKLTVTFKEQVEVNSSGVTSDLSSMRISGNALEILPEDSRGLLRALRRMAGVDISPQDLRVTVNGEAGGLPPKASIESITINLDPFEAQFSEPGQTAINVVTKPAQGGVSGGVSINYNNQSLNARNAFSPVRAPMFERNYEVYVAGPILKDRWGFMLSAGRPEQNASATINAVTLDPVTLAPQDVHAAATSRDRGANLTGRTIFRAAQRHIFNLMYRQSRDEAGNMGLDGGFDLPERAFGTSSRDDSASLGVNSILSQRLVNELHAGFGRQTFDARAGSTNPAVLVFNSFSGGGNQDSLYSHHVTQSLSFSDVATYVRSGHTFRAGVSVAKTRLNSLDRTGFGGTFTFGTDVERDASGAVLTDAGGQPIAIDPLESYRRTLLGLPGYRPSQFSIAVGDPKLALTQWEAAAFIQDDWPVGPKVSLSYGLREEFQTNLAPASRLSLAPRVGMAWRVSDHWHATLRGGAGLFYSRVGTDITLDALRFDGSRQQQLVVLRPSFYPAVPATFSDATVVQSAIRVKAPDLQAPRLWASQVSYGQAIVGPLRGSIRYAFQQGSDLLRTRNINAPDSAGLRPSPDAGPIFQVESTGRSLRHEVRLSLDAEFGSRFSFYGSYTRGSVQSDTDGSSTLPADSHNLSTEFGRSRSDRRDRVYVEGWVQLPYGIGASPSLTMRSGAPFNITTGADNNGDTVFADRPSFTTAGSPGAIVTPFGVFNPSPRPGEVIVPRNYGQGPGELTVDMNVSKTFGFGPTRADGHHRYHLTLSSQMENLTNRTNLAGYTGVITSPLFGQANRANDARRIRLAMDWTF